MIVEFENHKLNPTLERIGKHERCIQASAATDGQNAAGFGGRESKQER